MAFIQTIEVRADDEASLRDHVAGWHAEQAGIAPGYRGARILADEDTPGRFLIEVDFSSRDEADRNNARPETAAWAAKLDELTTSEPRFTNYRLVCTTEQGR
jgi:quinol monooxygenase YgiN